MSREVRRVPLDFDWPIKKVWHGYTQPSPKRPCPSPRCCNGWTPEATFLGEIANLILIADSDQDTTRPQHPWITDHLYGMGGVPKMDNIRPFVLGIVADDEAADRFACPLGPFGHDAIDRVVFTRRLIAIAGLPDDWGICPTCKGATIHPDDVDLEDPEPFDPPTGDGWQMWETTSEGSPISPVFGTPEELARWLADTRASTFGSMTAGYDQWLAMIVGPGWAPSAIGDATGYHPQRLDPALAKRNDIRFFHEKFDPTVTLRATPVNLSCEQEDKP